MSKADVHYLRRCIELAERGKPWVSPNPMVGSVVVKNRTIVGEGYHEGFGEYHAEYNALRDAGTGAQGATLYVNLEPCVHEGKTPPCTEAIIGAGIRHVVASSQDPNPLVGGRGFRELRRAGIKVTKGILKKESHKLNEKFFGAMEHRLPFVGIKLAQTLDGRIADSRNRSKWISSPDARTYAHILRTEYHAIMVGSTTIQMDDPELTVRFTEGRNPVRVVVDGRLRLSPLRKVFTTGAAQTILLTSSTSLNKEYRKAVALERKGVQVIGVDSRLPLTPKAMLRALFSLGVLSVLVEGGSKTIQPFLEHRLAQKIHCFVTPAILGSGTTGFSFGRLPLGRMIRLDDLSVRQLSGTMILEGVPRYQ